MKLNLTAQQKDELIEQYVQMCVDSMDYDSLEEFVRNTLIDDFDKLTDNQLKEEISCSFDEEVLEDLINNVCNEDKLTNVQN